MHKVAVRVLLFAKAREISGKKEDVVTVYSRISYRELFEFIVRYFALEDIKSSLILAINEQYSDANIPLKLNDGDTIAVIPPLSGGQSSNDTFLICILLLGIICYYMITG